MLLSRHHLPLMHFLIAVLLLLVVLLILFNWSLVVQHFNVRFLDPTAFPLLADSPLTFTRRSSPSSTFIVSLAHFGWFDYLFARYHDIVLSSAIASIPGSCFLACSHSLFGVAHNFLLHFKLRVISMILTIDFVAVNHAATMVISLDYSTLVS